jgi:hypothetical protein
VREVLLKQVARTGVHTIEREGDHYFLTLTNRTYHSEHEVSVETARRYWRSMCADARSGVAHDIPVTSD